MALAFAPYGREVTVKNIYADEKTKKHSGNLGILIGSVLTSYSDGKGDVIVKVKDGKLAINKALAMKIIVA